jgi:hypothetical protein
MGSTGVNQDDNSEILKIKLPTAKKSVIKTWQLR